jgi:hypothetical protein
VFKAPLATRARQISLVQTGRSSKCRHKRVQPCIDDIKVLYYTYLALNKGAAADVPVDDVARRLMADTVNDTLECILSRDLMLTNLAMTLSRTNSNNPLRGLRYLLNCLLKVIEGPLSPEARLAPGLFNAQHLLPALASSCYDCACTFAA